ncbi:MAG: ATP-binding cassette domain-containing protein [Streptosporangiaceae bacterium]
MDGVSFTVGEAEVLGIVGESGCGKTVTCRTIMGLMPARTAYSAGEVIYHPRGPGNILDLAPRDLQRLRGTQLAMIFQDPMTALNPVRTIGDQVTEAVTAHATLSRPQARNRAWNC